MRAVVFAGDGEIRVDDVPEPRLNGDDEVVVEVSLTAICGSDLHLLDGKTPGMRVGGVIGHEFVGTVREKGDKVTALDEGDRVVGSFLIACGDCLQCGRGAYNFCANRRALGLGTLTGDLDGAQAEAVRVPAATTNLKRLHEGPPALSDEQALFTGDVLATGFYAASLAGDAETVAVIGAGPIGLFSAAALIADGRRVVVLDTDPQRVTAAETTLGPDIACLAGDEPDAATAEALGDLADASVDAVGTIPAFKSAMRVVRDGGRVIVIGVYGAERFPFPMGMAWIRGLEIVFGGMANVQGNWERALGCVRSGEIDPTTVITHRLPLDEAVEGYRLFAAREATKVVLKP